MAVFLLPRVKQECCSGGNKLSNVGSFMILLSGEDLTSFNKDNSTNFSGKKKSTMKLYRVSTFLQYAREH